MAAGNDNKDGVEVAGHSAEYNLHGADNATAFKKIPKEAETPRDGALTPNPDNQTQGSASNPGMTTEDLANLTTTSLTDHLDALSPVNPASRENSTPPASDVTVSSGSENGDHQPPTPNTAESEADDEGSDTSQQASPEVQGAVESPTPTDARSIDTTPFISKAQAIADQLGFPDTDTKKEEFMGAANQFIQAKVTNQQEEAASLLKALKTIINSAPTKHGLTNPLYIIARSNLQANLTELVESVEKLKPAAADSPQEPDQQASTAASEGIETEAQQPAPSVYAKIPDTLKVKATNINDLSEIAQRIVNAMPLDEQKDIADQLTVFISTKVSTNNLDKSERFLVHSILFEGIKQRIKKNSLALAQLNELMGSEIITAEDSSATNTTQATQNSSFSDSSTHAAHSASNIATTDSIIQTELERTLKENRAEYNTAKNIAEKGLELLALIADEGQRATADQVLVAIYAATNKPSVDLPTARKHLDGLQALLSEANDTQTKFTEIESILTSLRDTTTSHDPIASASTTEYKKSRKKTKQRKTVHIEEHDFSGPASMSTPARTRPSTANSVTESIDASAIHSTLPDTIALTPPLATYFEGNAEEEAQKSFAAAMDFAKHRAEEGNRKDVHKEIPHESEAKRLKKAIKIRREAGDTFVYDEDGTDLNTYKAEKTVYLGKLEYLTNPNRKPGQPVGEELQPTVTAPYEIQLDMLSNLELDWTKELPPATQDNGTTTPEKFNIEEVYNTANTKLRPVIKKAERTIKDRSYWWFSRWFTYRESLPQMKRDVLLVKAALLQKNAYHQLLSHKTAWNNNKLAQDLRKLNTTDPEYDTKIRASIQEAKDLIKQRKGKRWYRKSNREMQLYVDVMKASLDQAYARGEELTKRPEAHKNNTFIYELRGSRFLEETVKEKMEGLLRAFNHNGVLPEINKDFFFSLPSHTTSDEALKKLDIYTCKILPSLTVLIPTIAKARNPYAGGNSEAIDQLIKRLSQKLSDEASNSTTTDAVITTRIGQLVHTLKSLEAHRHLLGSDDQLHSYIAAPLKDYAQSLLIRYIKESAAATLFKLSRELQKTSAEQTELPKMVYGLFNCEGEGDLSSHNNLIAAFNNKANELINAALARNNIDEDLFLFLFQTDVKVEFGDTALREQALAMYAKQLAQERNTDKLNALLASAEASDDPDNLARKCLSTSGRILESVTHHDLTVAKDSLKKYQSQPVRDVLEASMLDEVETYKQETEDSIIDLCKYIMHELNTPLKAFHEKNQLLSDLEKNPIWQAAKRKFHAAIDNSPIPDDKATEEFLDDILVSLNTEDETQVEDETQTEYVKALRAIESFRFSKNFVPKLASAAHASNDEEALVLAQNFKTYKDSKTYSVALTIPDQQKPSIRAYLDRNSSTLANKIRKLRDHADNPDTPFEGKKVALDVLSLNSEKQLALTSLKIAAQEKPAYTTEAPAYNPGRSEPGVAAKVAVQVALTKTMQSCRDYVDFHTPLKTSHGRSRKTSFDSLYDHLSSRLNERLLVTGAHLEYLTTEVDDRLLKKLYSDVTSSMEKKDDKNTTKLKDVLAFQLSLTKLNEQLNNGVLQPLEIAYRLEALLTLLRDVMPTESRIFIETLLNDSQRIIAAAVNACITEADETAKLTGQQISELRENTLAPLIDDFAYFGPSNVSSVPRKGTESLAKENKKTATALKTFVIKKVQGLNFTDSVSQLRSIRSELSGYADFINRETDFEFFGRSASGISMYDQARKQLMTNGHKIFASGAHLEQVVKQLNTDKPYVDPTAAKTDQKEKEERAIRANNADQKFNRQYSQVLPLYQKAKQDKISDSRNAGQVILNQFPTSNPINQAENFIEHFRNKIQKQKNKMGDKPKDVKAKALDAFAFIMSLDTIIDELKSAQSSASEISALPKLRMLQTLLATHLAILPDSSKGYKTVLEECHKKLQKLIKENVLSTDTYIAIPFNAQFFAHSLFPFIAEGNDIYEQMLDKATETNSQTHEKTWSKSKLKALFVRLNKEYSRPIIDEFNIKLSIYSSEDAVNKPERSEIEKLQLMAQHAQSIQNSLTWSQQLLLNILSGHPTEQIWEFDPSFLPTIELIQNQVVEPLESYGVVRVNKAGVVAEAATRANEDEGKIASNLIHPIISMLNRQHSKPQSSQLADASSASAASSHHSTPQRRQSNSASLLSTLTNSTSAHSPNHSSSISTADASSLSTKELERLRDHGPGTTSQSFADVATRNASPSATADALATITATNAMPQTPTQRLIHKRDATLRQEPFSTPKVSDGGAMCGGIWYAGRTPGKTPRKQVEEMRGGKPTQRTPQGKAAPKRSSFWATLIPETPKPQGPADHRSDLSFGFDL